MSASTMKMQLFISWSGKPSQQIAEALRGWIPQVLQHVQPFMSSHDIDKGERWTSVVSGKLEQMNFGLIVLTEENFEKPWIQFEAGALSKLGVSRVVPLACGFSVGKLSKNPLGYLQAATFEKSEIKAALSAINDQSESALDLALFEKSFERWWPDLKEEYEKIELKSPKETKNAIDSTNQQILDSIDLVLSKITRLERHVYRSEQAEEKRFGLLSSNTNGGPGIGELLENLATQPAIRKQLLRNLKSHPQVNVPFSGPPKVRDEPDQA
jgi:hypothetical protein